MLSWHCPSPPTRDPAVSHSLFPEGSCPCPQGYSTSSCPPGPPPEVHEHLQHSEVGREQFQEFPHPSPSMLLPAERFAFPGERAAAPNSSPGKLLAARAAVPGHRAGLGPALQGRGRPQRWLCSCSLLAASPQPCRDTYEVESPFHQDSPAAFARGCVTTAGSGSSPSRLSPGKFQARSDPGGVWPRSAPPGVCIYPSWSRFPSPSLPVPPPTQVPWGEEQ